MDTLCLQAAQACSVAVGVRKTLRPSIGAELGLIQNASNCRTSGLETGWLEKWTKARAVITIFCDFVY
jgi:hypothetical protein